MRLTTHPHLTVRHHTPGNRPTAPPFAIVDSDRLGYRPPQRVDQINPMFPGKRWTASRLHGVVRVIVGLLVLLVSAAPTIANADTMNLALVATFSEVIDNIRNWLIGILGGVATVFFTFGGVRRMMAGGDPGEHEKAKECFKAAGIGYGLAALAPLVVVALKGIVGL